MKQLMRSLATRYPPGVLAHKKAFITDVAMRYCQEVAENTGSGPDARNSADKEAEQQSGATAALAATAPAAAGSGEQSSGAKASDVRLTDDKIAVGSASEHSEARLAAREMLAAAETCANASPASLSQARSKAVTQSASPVAAPEVPAAAVACGGESGGEMLADTPSAGALPSWQSPPAHRPSAGAKRAVKRQIIMDDSSDDEGDHPPPSQPPTLVPSPQDQQQSPPPLQLQRQSSPSGRTEQQSPQSAGEGHQSPLSATVPGNGLQLTSPVATLIADGADDEGAADDRPIASPSPILDNNAAGAEPVSDNSQGEEDVFDSQDRPSPVAKRARTSKTSPSPAKHSFDGATPHAKDSFRASGGNEGSGTSPAAAASQLPDVALAESDSLLRDAGSLMREVIARGASASTVYAAFMETASNLLKEDTAVTGATAYAAFLDTAANLLEGAQTTSGDCRQSATPAAGEHSSESAQQRSSPAHAPAPSDSPSAAAAAGEGGSPSATGVVAVAEEEVNRRMQAVLKDEKLKLMRTAAKLGRSKAEKAAQVGQGRGRWSRRSQ